MLVERKKNRNVNFEDINAQYRCYYFKSLLIVYILAALMFFAFTIAQTKKNGPQTRFKNFLLSGFKIFAGVQCAKQYFSKSG